MLSVSHLQWSPRHGDQDTGTLEESKNKHGNDDQAVDELVELEVWIVVDHPLVLLLRVEGGAPRDVGPPLLLQPVTVVHPDLKPDGSGQPEEDEETDGEEEEKLDWVGRAMVQVLQKRSPALV